MERSHDRNVIVCLYELAKTARKFNVQEPELVKLERLISESEGLLSEDIGSFLLEEEALKSGDGLPGTQKDVDQVAETSQNPVNIDTETVESSDRKVKSDVEDTKSEAQPVAEVAPKPKDEFEGLPMNKQQDLMVLY